ncbi:hypothetical protein Franean1_2030 [Parafrankia sp. EAN1pec]|nr:hypothetical protein Franean1_2030 [Frankia sp. EAN1pec]
MTFKVFRLRSLTMASPPIPCCSAARRPVPRPARGARLRVFAGPALVRSPTPGDGRGASGPGDGPARCGEAGEGRQPGDRRHRGHGHLDRVTQRCHPQR